MVKTRPVIALSALATTLIICGCPPGPIGPVDHHDEPIIIDNGPVKLDFNPKTHGSLLPSVGKPKQFGKIFSAPIRFVRFLYDGKQIDCVAGAQCAGKLWKAGTRINIALKDGSIEATWLNTDKGALLVTSSKEFYQPDPTVPTRIALEDSTSYVVKVELAGNTTVYPRNPGNPTGEVGTPDYAKPIKILMCADAGKCD